MMDSIKHTSFQNLQGELDSHMETMSGQVRAHQAQQALSLHKVDMEASVVEVSCKLNQESRVCKGVQNIVYGQQYLTVNMIPDVSILRDLICK